MLDLRLKIILNVPLRLLYVVLTKVNILTHATELLNLLDVLVLCLELLFASIVSIVSRYHRVHALIDCILLVSFTFEAIEHLFYRAAATEAFLMRHFSPILFRGLNLVRKYALGRRNVLGSNVCLFDGLICTCVVTIQMLGHLPLIWDVEPAAVPSLF